ncbi:DUF6776 family protein [Shewanella surugensis]|uniref:Uncharacterized protein n=1 Tax=Shewanella surugensis TaxID=212020 RepID=A0ABT0L628_9GAMM|nr:DUF6776 family protein [Shewanella surugensis]MCL1123137.1 hypothetical protein [Shewanella surugensis]
MSNYYRWLDRMQAMERKFYSSKANLLLLLVVVFILGGVSANAIIPYFKMKADGSVQSVSAEGMKVQVLNQKLAARKLELSMSIKTNEGMKAMFEAQHSKQKELERELAFYRSIMSPESNADGVVINGFELSSGLLSEQYRIKLVLTQLQNKKQSLKGNAEVTFIGLSKGQRKEIKLSGLSKASFQFQFRYFQVLETSVTFPDDFTLSSIKVKVVVPKGRWSKGSKTEKEYTLQELQLEEKEAEGILDQSSQVLDNLSQ